METTPPLRTEIPLHLAAKQGRGGGCQTTEVVVAKETPLSRVSSDGKLVARGMVSKSKGCLASVWRREQGAEQESCLLPSKLG